MNFVNPSFFAYLVMAAYPLLGLIFDARLPRHKAILATMLVGFLFLPSVQVDLGGALFWNRTSAPFFVILVGVIFRDGALLSELRFRRFDIPMLVWCLVPIASSVTAGFGAYDGLSQAFYQAIQWGGPYFLGRLHFRTKEQLYDLARFIFIGGLIYIPLCLFEVRMSPMLHNTFYGFHQHDFAQTIRGSLYRPMVFLQHGLMVAMWVGMTTYLGWVLTKVGGGIRFLGVSAKFWPPIMMASLLLMQSFGAMLLVGTAVGLTSLSRATQGKTLLLVLAFIPAAWSLTRSTGILPSSAIPDVASVIEADRANSLDFRLDAEDRLINHAWKQALFGWSPGGFNRTADAPGKRGQVVADGLWIISFAAFGFVGLAAMLLFHLVPFLIVLREVPPRRWESEPLTWVIGSMGIIIAIISVDNLMNSMVNPLFLVMMGALSTVLSRPGWDNPDDEVDLPAAPEGEPSRFGRLLGTRTEP